MKTSEIFKLTLPVMMGYVPLGAAFGILAASSGLSLAQTMAISFFVYSGTAEFLLIAFIVAGESLLGIFLTLFLLGFRHFFYTLSLLGELRGLNLLRFYAIYAMSDESFALLSTYKNDISRNVTRAQKSFHYALLCFLNQSYWILGGVFGFIFQKKVAFDYSGIEFSLNALFIVLAYDSYRQNPNKKLLLIALAVGLFGFLMIDKSYMLFACLSLAMCVLLLGRRYV